MTWTKEGLGERGRKIIFLRDHEGWTFQRIGEALGHTADRARYLYLRAKELGIGQE